MNAPNPIDIQKYLARVDYPASKDTLVETATREGAAADILKALSALPDGTYNGPTEVSSALSQS